MRNPYIFSLSASAFVAAASCLAGCGGSSDSAAKGEKALSEGNYADAASFLADAVKQNPGDVDAAVRLAEAHFARGENEAADAAVKDALRLRPDGAGPLLMDGKVACALRDWKRATASFGKLLDPKSGASREVRASALNGIAVVVRADGSNPDKDEAFAALLHAIYLDPGNPAATYHLAGLVADKFPFEAKDLYSQFVRMPGADPRHVKIVEDTALPALRRKIKEIEARRSAKTDAAKSMELLKEANALRLKRKTREAHAKFKKAIALDPSNDDAIAAFIDLISRNRKTFPADNPIETYKTAVSEWRPSPKLRRKLCIDASEYAVRNRKEVMAVQFLERLLVSDSSDLDVLRRMAALEKTRSNGMFRRAAARYRAMAEEVRKDRSGSGR